MSQTVSSDYDRTYARSDARSAAYMAEHSVAWILVFAALVLGTIGLLRGFAIIGDEATAGLAQDVPGVTEEVATAGDAANPFADGIVWFLPAIAAALLASGLHRSEHHKRGPHVAPGSMHAESKGDMAYKTEHGLSYLMVAGALGAGTLALLVGFDLFNNGNVQQDGWLWGLAAIGIAIVANTLHAVGHHQYDEEDYIVGIIDERMSAARPTATRTTTTVREERPIDQP